MLYCSPWRHRLGSEAFSLCDSSDLQATRCCLRFQWDNIVLHDPLTLIYNTPTNTSISFTAYLHVVEETRFLKVELDIYTALPKSFSAPAQVVISRPHPQLLCFYEVVSSQDAITQLTQASKLHPAGTHKRSIVGVNMWLRAEIMLHAADCRSLSIYKCIHVAACNIHI